MKIIYTLIKIILLLAFILLAVSNTQTIAFNYLPGQAWNLPLIALLLLFFVVGAVFGVLAMFGRLLTLRNEVNRLRAEVKKTAKNIPVQTVDNNADVVAVKHAAPAAELHPGINKG